MNFILCVSLLSSSQPVFYSLSTVVEYTCGARTAPTRHMSSNHHQMPCEPAAYPQVPTAPVPTSMPGAYQANEAAWQHGSGYPPYVAPEPPYASATEPSAAGTEGTRGVESTLDKLLRLKHRVMHPMGHTKHKIKHSAMGKPVRIAKK